MIQTEIHGRVFRIDSHGFLSPAEETALEDWLHDMRAQDAAQKRHRSVETIKHHRKHIREKTRAHTASGVLSYCLSKDYIRIMVLAGLAAAVEPVVQNTQQQQQVVRVHRARARQTRIRDLAAMVIPAGGAA